MARVEREIEVELPVSTVYNQWTQFEEFPRFMDGVEEVRQIDPRHLYWRADVGGKEKEWQATITRQEPGRLIAWESDDGARNDGIVIFQPLSDTRSRITLALDYQPHDFVETVGGLLGFVARRVEGNLQRFKEFIESRGVETGAWRGTIR